MDKKMDSASRDAEGAKGGRAISSDAIGNVSKAHRERLLAEVAAIKSFLERSGDTNATRLLSFAADLEKEMRGRKFGLVFEEHRERVDVELEENIPVLEEVKERFISHGGSEAQSPLNFLIEGDNLAALKLLEKTHRGKIDLIYIDPPYNTGNKDFIYNDSYVDKTDTFRHSKWLSFMRKRLEIAKRLMSDKGVIFISIDDNEQSALKLLCDDVFGESNFLANVIWEKTDSPRMDVQTVSVRHDYILVYCKREFHPKRITSESIPVHYNKKDNNGRLYYLKPLKIMGGHKSKSLFFPLTAPDGSVVLPYEKNGEEGGWRWSMEKIEREGADRLEWIHGKNGWTPYFRIFAENRRGRPVETIWPFEEVGSTRTAKNDLKHAIGDTSFNTPKPIALIDRILKISISVNSTVLDFFAGSGTTGHAVMKLNAEDGGKRKFILVTNNENDICEKVTYERLKRVMEKEGYAASLKYFKIGFVPIGEEGYWDMADALLGHIRELVELENGIDFDHDNSVAIVLTDEELAEFMARISTQRRKGAAAAGPRILYKGHNVILGTKTKKELERRGVRVETIPDYYYPELEG